MLNRNPNPTDMRLAQSPDGIWIAQDRNTGCTVACDERGDLRVRPGDKPTVGAMRIFSWVLGCAWSSEQAAARRIVPFKA